ncbi:NAD+ synthetase [endosymbiont of Acanthamoeba sp. UWC8]|uniref:NAD+ synthase n=1 Tax=endosymbiont of Acanthamoeba sp. UWC8 TaxID=86106 RepID=UPI0004D0B83F|nr:NAD+ synthase [endosymbiont of Acanthamoeba sp. UWC8]AIF81846.1 NAD+ synthetase [endosymbiont of Acanthamoeba sp. UWC8]
MKIFLAQVKPRIGDIEYNFDLIQNCYLKACENNVDICLFPEMISVGYTPEDLLHKPSFLTELEKHTALLIKNSQAPAILLSTVIKEKDKLYNAILAIQNGQVIGKSYKQCIPNYGVFDEERYFSSGEPRVIDINGYKIGVPICEDMWFPEAASKLKEEGAEILLVPNASPYDGEKFNTRLEIIKKRYQEVGLPIIYCNQVLGQDGIVFEGRSFGYDGSLKFCLAAFRKDSILVDVQGNKILTTNNIENFSKEDELYGAMVLGLRDYMHNNRFKSVLLGLSGGIDSALVAAIAVDALGKENVHAIMMPSKFTGRESLEDAERVAEMLGISYRVIAITDIVETIDSGIGGASGIAYENLQSRARGIILMSISNMTQSLVLTTGNKSENAVGYATLYGDMCGGFNPIKDLYKTGVFNIAKFRNSKLPASIQVMNSNSPVMPERVITKPPSAELREDQKDSDSLPEYSILDQILEAYIEQDLGKEEIIDKGFDKETVEKVIKLIKISEYKRRQSAPGVKLTTRTLDKERRYPITNLYKG